MPLLNYLTSLLPFDLVVEPNLVLAVLIVPVGPAKVVAKRGEHSYDVRLEPGRIVQAHATFLKKHQTDVFSGNPTPLYFHRRTVPETHSRLAE